MRDKIRTLLTAYGLSFDKFKIPGWFVGNKYTKVKLLYPYHRGIIITINNNTWSIKSFDKIDNRFNYHKNRNIEGTWIKTKGF